jgi:hypothetical protein
MTIPSPPSRNNPRKRRWSAKGGNRLDRLTSALVGDQHRVDALPPTSPRKVPTLPRLHFLEIRGAST